MNKLKPATLGLLCFLVSLTAPVAVPVDIHSVLVPVEAREATT